MSICPRIRAIINLSTGLLVEQYTQATGGKAEITVDDDGLFGITGRTTDGFNFDYRVTFDVARDTPVATTVVTRDDSPVELTYADLPLRIALFRAGSSDAATEHPGNRDHDRVPVEQHSAFYGERGISGVINDLISPAGRSDLNGGAA